MTERHRLKDKDAGITLDAEFPCASCGGIRKLTAGHYEVDYRREELPAWFQAVLDELFQGRGVPKEYSFCVRVHNAGSRPRSVVLRFLTSPLGRRYLAPPYWVRTEEGWNVIPSERTSARPTDEYLETEVDVPPARPALVASMPLISPEAVNERVRRLADWSGIWTCRQIGRTAQGRPILALETEPRPIKICVQATMQPCEPVSWGILHAAHWLTIPTARTKRLLDNAQFCLVPVTNPDGIAEGRSVTNARGEVPKFSLDFAVAGKSAPRETIALWTYACEKLPRVCIEVHAHARWDRFWRSIGLSVVDAMPPALRGRGEALEATMKATFPPGVGGNRMSMIDPRTPQGMVYGYQHFHEKGVLCVAQQAVSYSIEGQGADVREMVEAVSNLLINKKQPARSAE